MIQSYTFSSSSIIAGSTTKSLNFSPKDTHSRSKVLSFIKHVYEIESLKVFYLTQKHTSDVFILSNDKVETSNIEADAIITQIKDVMIGVYTADCIPLLMYDPIQSVIAAIHAGRRGYQKGVVLNTVNKMITEFSSLPDSLEVVIGPNLIKKDNIILQTDIDNFPQEHREKHIELRPEGASLNQNQYLHEKFCNENNLPFDYFPKPSALSDMPAMIIDDLIRIGVDSKNIYNSHLNTYKSETFHSYRGDHPNNGHTFNFIMMK